MEANVGWRSLQERFERTVVGRVLISVFLLLTLVTLLTANLPESRLQSLLLSADHPYLYGVALDQSWGVFSPDPRRQTIDVRAVVTFSDGSHATWRVPRRNPVIGEYTDYRWLKWAEYVIQPTYATPLLRPIALYVARRFASPTRRPTQVKLINRWRPLEPPGHKLVQLLEQERKFYTLHVTPAMLRGSEP